MSGTSRQPLQNSRLLYVSTTTSKLPVPENDLDIGTFLSNRGNFYGGYSICEVSFINNFYNVRNNECGMSIKIFRSDNNTEVYEFMKVKPGQWYIDDLCADIVKQITDFCVNIGYITHPVFKLEPVGPHDTRLKSTNFYIFPSDYGTTEQAVSGLATVLGFVLAENPTNIYDMSFQDFPTTPLIKNEIINIQLATYARLHHKLDRYSMVYLHSNALKHDTSYSSDGKTTNMVQAIPNNNDFEGFVHYSNELGITQPHFIFSQVRELSQIDFMLTDETGQLLQCVDNNLQIVLRLFY